MLKRLEHQRAAFRLRAALVREDGAGRVLLGLLVQPARATRSGGDFSLLCDECPGFGRQTPSRHRLVDQRPAPPRPVRSGSCLVCREARLLLSLSR